MNHLQRELAPISAAAWEEIEEEAKGTLELALAARKIVDFEGPLGWAKSSVDTGHTDELKKAPAEGVEAGKRRVKPLVELMVPFTLSRKELESIDRGGKEPDLDAVIEAARKIAVAENTILLDGYKDGEIEGIREVAENKHTVKMDGESYLGAVAKAMGELKDTGVAGPYALLLGREAYAGLAKSTLKGGFRLHDHVAKVLDGPIMRCVGLEGGLLVSQRGGDFEMTVGQDLSIGYLHHDAKNVTLYLQESLTFRPLTPEAAIVLDFKD